MVALTIDTEVHPPKILLIGRPRCARCTTAWPAVWEEFEPLSDPAEARRRTLDYGFAEHRLPGRFGAHRGGHRHPRPLAR
jgi:hypothetical protein